LNSLNFPIGRVYLVGAGPGDPGLITVRGAQKLAEADVVLHDGLANPAFRVLARVDAAWISVGKHGGDRIWKQSEIDDAIVEHARSGKTVVRLKGGDTGVFARTAEELERLVSEGIPFEVVPGITAGLAVAAYTGIPITHRDWSSAVAIVTGQLQPSDGGPEIDESNDWEALANFPGTLVVYMGVTTAGIWSNRLLAAGKPPETPVAIVRRCSWPDQEVIYCQLDQVGNELTPASKFRPPVIAVIGPVAHLGTPFDWFSKRPLFGTTVLVSRPAEQALDTVQQLNDLGADVLMQSSIEIRPVVDFEPLDARINSLSTYDWIVFTSTNGVDYFFSRMQALGLDGRALHACRIAGVGPSIVTALKRWNMGCDLIPDGGQELYNAVHLSERLIRKLSEKAGNQCCLVVRANRGKTTVEDAIKAVGYAVDSVIAYLSVDVEQAEPHVRRAAQARRIDYVFVTSRLIASNLARLFVEDLRNAKWIAISEDVAEVIKNLGFRVHSTAKQSSVASMIECLLEIEHR